MNQDLAHYTGLQSMRKTETMCYRADVFQSDAAMCVSRKFLVPRVFLTLSMLLRLLKIDPKQSVLTSRDLGQVKAQPEAAPNRVDIGFGCHMERRSTKRRRKPARDSCRRDSGCYGVQGRFWIPGKDFGQLQGRPQQVFEVHVVSINTWSF